MMNQLKLFCFPYAGGSAALYRHWPSLFNPHQLTVVPVELAGRGRRIREPLYENVDEMTGDIFERIKDELLPGRYAFFGHSMGAMICYELTQHVVKLGFPPPVHVFFSGRGAPHVPRPDLKEYYRLPEDAFRQAVFSLGGTPPEFFSTPGLAELFLPLLRNDFRLAETAPCRDPIQPLPCSISVFMGREEDLNAAQRSEWTKHTVQECFIHGLEGGHFFIHQQSGQLADLITSTLFETAFA